MMKKLILTILISITAIGAFAQEKTNYVDVTGNIGYLREPEEYKLEVMVSPDPYNTRYHEKPPTVKSVKSNYFEKLKKNKISRDQFKESKSVFNDMNSYSYNQKGTALVYKTKSKDEFIKVLGIKLRGIVIKSKQVKYKEVQLQKLIELQKKALNETKIMARALAKASNKELGELIFIRDASSFNYNKSAYYEPYYRKSKKRVYVRLNARYSLK